MARATPKIEKQRGARNAQGGNDKMFKPQAAGPAKPGRVGKVETPAPGATKAIGGAKTFRSPSLVMPAKGGHTAPLGKGR